MANAGGPYTGAAGTAVSFSGAASTDPQGETLTYAWNFGDSGTGTGVSPTHTYAAAGTYTVTLTVTNTSNLTATATSKATIAAQPPVANAGGPYTGVDGVALSFSGAASTDPQGETLTYAWNFGDSSTGTGVSPTHTYSTIGTYTVTLTVTNTSNLTSTATVKVIVPNGRVYGGQQPVAGAHVYLFAANTTGYGQASVSLLSAASTGQSDSVGAYVLTGADGSFFTAGDYSCTPGSQVYLYSLGGSAGSGTNTGIGLLAALGACPSAGNFAATPYAVMNEVSTIAAAYAFAGFATDATHVSSSGTALAQVGVANAFANAANLATLSTGTALSTTPAGNGTVPQTEINTLANILADCVNTSGPGSNGCQLLFTNAMSGGSTGTVPTDTATATINIAHHPGANIATLYGLASTAVFTPKLAAQPNDFTVSVVFTGGGMYETAGLAVDGSGNVWVANESGSGNATAGSVIELSSSGAFLSGASGFTNSTLYAPLAVAIDLSGDAWVGSNNGTFSNEISQSGSFVPGIFVSNGVSGSYATVAIDGSENVWFAGGNPFVTVFSSTGKVLSGTSGYSGGGLTGVASMAIDGSGNAWFANNRAQVFKYSNSGTVLSGTSGYATGSCWSFSDGIAIDGAGNAWISVGSGYSIIELSNSGTVTNTITVPSYAGCSGYGYYGIAIDGAGRIWVATYSNLTELSNTGTVLSGANGYLNNGSNAGLYDLAIDSSGNIWTTSGGNAIIELVGAATPVITPIAAGLPATPTANGTSNLGTRP
ncbi:MAG: PKD domain-containing protein [Acidobacteriaceae bacterium]